MPQRLKLLSAARPLISYSNVTAVRCLSQSSSLNEFCSITGFTRRHTLQITDVLLSVLECYKRRCTPVVVYLRPAVALQPAENVSHKCND